MKMYKPNNNERFGSQNFWKLFNIRDKGGKRELRKKSRKRAKGKKRTNGPSDYVPI